MDEPGVIPGQNIPVIPLLALAVTRSFGSPEDADVQALVFPVRALFCSSLQVTARIPYCSLLFVGAVWPCRSLCQPSLRNCCSKESSLKGSWSVCSPEFR